MTKVMFYIIASQECAPENEFLLGWDVLGERITEILEFDDLFAETNADDLDYRSRCDGSDLVMFKDGSEATKFLSQFIEMPAGTVQYVELAEAIGTIDVSSDELYVFRLVVIYA